MGHLADLPLTRTRFDSLLALAARQWRRAIDTRLARYDLTEASWVPLMHIGRSARAMRQRDLAEMMSLDSSSVVRVLKQLEGAGLIERGEDEGDRRAKALVVTANGRALMQKLASISESLQHELLEGFTPAEIATTQRILEQVCNRLLAAHAGGRHG